MLGRLSRHLRRCWWRYSGHYVSNVAIAENAASDVCRYMYPESCDDDKGQHNRYILLNSGLCGDTRSGSSVIVITSISSIIDICTLYTLTAAFISRAEKKVARWKVSS